MSVPAWLWFCLSLVIFVLIRWTVLVIERKEKIKSAKLAKFEAEMKTFDKERIDWQIKYGAELAQRHIRIAKYKALAERRAKLRQIKKENRR